ncbi:YcnI family copper-binding membrane protein [Tomitella biformata]|uniref:YcnI family copper-binding membrane protein n=1 Tax=Tomitella biformata TaxID=630403 RepID=UPI00046703B1|nr:YcnI family protein [Tomitella biformata]
MKTFTSRALCTASLVGAVMVAGTGFASAHVSVNAPGATQGGYDVLTFRVPTESETAGTTGLTVQLPGLRSARTEPLPGWQSVVTKDPTSNLATEVTWTADPGVQVGPGQFSEFRISAGPLPESGTVEFPTSQTYSDGTVVNWDQQAGADGTEPEHPAPVLSLSPSTGEAHGTVTATPESTATAAESPAESDSTARWLGGAGLVLGAIALALSIGNTVRRRP